MLGDHVFVGYGDNHAPDGSDGLSSQVVDYRPDGSVRHIYTVKGHNDGLKIDPCTRELWALQNEDANANLVIIDPDSGHMKEYLFGPTLHGGGYDDMVSVRLDGNGSIDIEPALAGTANAIDIPTDKTIQLNLQDPDSMTTDPLGNIVLDSQGDQELIIVSHPGQEDQRALRLPLSYQTAGALSSVETDDTAFVTSTQGFLLFADKGLNTVYVLSRNAFVPGTAYTAADGGPFVGTLDLTTGVITPVVTGLSNPGGMVFVDTSRHDPDHDRDDGQGGH